MPDNTPGPAATTAGLTEEIDSIVKALTAGRLSYCCETDLHEGMTQALLQAGIYVGPGHREVRLSPADRIDFLRPSGLGVEVKIKGPTAPVWRQLRRYADSERVTGLLLVTTVTRHAVGAPQALNGKPVRTLVLRGGW